MYAVNNYKTKKALREAVKAGFAGGIFQLGPYDGNAPSDGVVSLEGPHYPAAHSWYAEALVANNVIVRILG